MIRFAALFVGCTTWLFAACVATPGQDEKPAKVDIRGTIKKVAALGLKDVIGSIRVEGMKEKDTEYDKAIVRIVRKTKIEKLEGKERKPATFKDLKEGTIVQAVFDGPVAESYPVQATAGAILILPAKKE